MLKRTRALVFPLAIISAIAQTPVIRVPVQLVAVPAAVTSASGQFVRDLGVSDFELFDNDRPQKFHFDFVDEPLSVAIVVQTNDSVGAWLPQVRRTASTIEAMLIGARGEASVISFDDEVRVIQVLTASIPLLDNAIGSLKISAEKGNRMLDAVLNASRQLAQTSTERRRIVVLIAQSGDGGSRAKLSDVIRELESNNIVVFSLLMPRFGKELVQKTVSVKDVKGVFGASDTGIMANIDLAKLIPEIFRSEKAAAAEDELSVITSETGGRRMPFRQLSDLEKSILTIGEEIHTEYVLSYTPDRHEDGYHRIVVRVRRPNVIVRARPGYYVHSDAQ